VWHEDRKPANVMLVVDTSGSMSDEQKLVQAKQGLSVFLHQLSSRDRVGLIWFEGRVHAAVPVRPFGKDATQLTSTINDLVADGDTALYDAVAEGVGEVDALKDESRINAVVVLTDGADTASSLSSSSLVARLRARSQSEGRQIRVFTIAYGSAPNRQVLQEIADASGGKAYAGDPTEIQAVYLQISSFF
jgi:Ca-activated chloride channel family protein